MESADQPSNNPNGMSRSANTVGKGILSWLGRLSLILTLCACACWVILLFIAIEFTQAGREKPTETVDFWGNVFGVGIEVFSGFALVLGLVRIFQAIIRRKRWPLNFDFACALFSTLISVPLAYQSFVIEIQRMSR